MGQAYRNSLVKDRTKRVLSHTGSLLLLVLSVCPLESTAQCIEDWKPGGSLPGLSGPVLAMTPWDRDGDGPEEPVLVVGGNFGIAGGIRTNRVAVWDGKEWNSLGNSSLTDLYAITIFDGMPVIGGWKPGPGGGGAISRWNGTSWESVGPSPFFDIVKSLTVFDGQLICAGGFWSSNGSGYVMRFTGSTWVSLSTSSQTANNPIDCLQVYDGNLIAGGRFSRINGVVANGIARWDGVQWHAMGTGVVVNQTLGIFALIIHEGHLVAGGSFSSMNGQSMWNISKWNGESWSPFSANPGIVYEMTVHDGALIAGGPTVSVGGTQFNHIARWTGSQWQPMDGGTDGSIYTMASFNGSLIAAGSFSSAGDAATKNIAAWSEENAWSSLYHGIDDAVLAIRKHGGHMVVAGRFRSIGELKSANRIASWDGQLWASLGTGFNDEVSALGEFEGQLVAGGLFTEAGGKGANHIAYWNGVSWEAIGDGLSGQVLALCEHNGRLFAGGNFSANGSYPASGIAQWDGVSWQPIGLGIDGVVYALTEFRGDLIAAGIFGTAGGHPIDYVARWDESDWHPIGDAVYAPVFALAVHNDRLIVAGYWLGGVYSTVAAWDGETWEPLTGTTFLSNQVNSLAVIDNYLVAGGQFTILPEMNTFGLAWWSGTEWSNFGTGLIGDYDSTTTAITQFDGDMVVGGSFLAADDHVSPYLARWGPPSPQITGQPNDASQCVGGQVVLSASATGEPPLSYQWLRDNEVLLDGPNVVGVNDPTLILTHIDLTDHGHFQLLVTDACGTSRSRSTQLTVACCGSRASGDLNGDGRTDGQDIAPFVQSILESSRAGAEVCYADFDYDRVMSEQDIPHFVSALLAE